jgi:hypothetical protein
MACPQKSGMRSPLSLLTLALLGALYAHTSSAAATTPAHAKGTVGPKTEILVTTKPGLARAPPVGCVSCEKSCDQCCAMHEPSICGFESR